MCSCLLPAKGPTCYCVATIELASLLHNSHRVFSVCSESNTEVKNRNVFVRVSGGIEYHEILEHRYIMLVVVKGSFFMSTFGKSINSAHVKKGTLELYMK